MINRNQLCFAREWKFFAKSSVLLIAIFLNVEIGKASPENSLSVSLVNSLNDIEQSIIQGSIVDDQGRPLSGANVLVKGTSRGVVADFDGNFSIEASIGEILEVSYIGMETIAVTLTKLDYLTITLITDAASLDEVVVVGYGTQKKKDLTGAIVTVKPEDFTPGVNVNATQLLNGAAAGVNVSQVSSAPGGGIKVQIRGAGSINSSNDVLFVVDGLPGVDPQSLSPADIESIQVLKDASASSIYGTRAANGVVLVTTKRGKAGKTTLSYSTYTGSQHIAKQVDVLGGADYMRLINLRSGDNPVYSDAEISAIGNGTNWQDQIFKSAPVQNHQITMSGGNEKGNYYLGLNYFDQGGIVKTSGYNKYNARLNMQTRPIEKLLVSANINFTREGFKEILFSNAANDFAGPINTAIQFDPTISTKLDENGYYLLNPTIALDNPLGLINGISDESIRNSFYGSLQVDYDLIRNLKATVRLGAEANNRRDDFYRSRIAQLGRSVGGSGSVGSTEYTHWLTEYLLKYENNFNDAHDFSILGGATFEEFLTRDLGASSAGFLSDVTGTNLLQSGDGELSDNVSSSRLKNTLNGFLGRMTYGYKDRYLFTASFRIDGSSRFSKDNKYAFFPSGSIGWNISQEPFLINSTWVNNLKLRIGYGELGNQGINNFETTQTLVAGGNSVFGGSIFQGVIPSRLPNPDLKWETTAETNFGLDFSFFGNRISGTLDYFNRKTSDQLFVKPLPSVVGFTAVRTNLGEVENKGFEIGLQTKNLVGDFSWNTNLNLAFLKNEVTQLPDFTERLIGGNVGTFINDYFIVQEGSALRSFYGFEIDGVFQEGDDIENSPTPGVSGYAPGMPKFVDQNDDGVIDEDDRVVLGNPFPDFSFGLNNSFKYKRLSLNVFVLGVQGIETLDANVTESLYPTNDARNTISEFYFNRWTTGNPTNDYPSGINPSLYGGARSINSWTVVDASFIRLKNVTLGYDLPVDKLGPISSLRIFVAAENLATITNYKGYDPDASAAGADNVTKVNYNSYPLARTFRVGVDVKF